VDESAVLARVRWLLQATLMVGLLGMSAELVLLGHFASASQVIPLLLLGVGLVVLVWHLAAPGPASVRALQGVMVLFVVSGGIGIGLHYDGNVQHELEASPSMGGLELIRSTLSGATPVLAPGAMALLGLVGLALLYRHPALDRP
jgi:hypothetical protein